jgi:hypothetical protein
VGRAQAGDHRDRARWTTVSCWPDTLVGVDEASAKAHLHRALQQGRDALLWKLEGLDEYDARRPMTPTRPTCSAWSST